MKNPTFLPCAIKTKAIKQGFPFNTKGEKRNDTAKAKRLDARRFRLKNFRTGFQTHAICDLRFAICDLFFARNCSFYRKQKITDKFKSQIANRKSQIGLLWRDRAGISPAFPLLPLLFEEATPKMF